MLHLRAHLSAGLALATLLLASIGRAEPSAADRALATELFSRGRELLSGGDTAAACPKLEESQRLDPAGGTLLNLALCWEKQGRYASAWTAFREALEIATREGRGERIDAARGHIAALAPKVSRLVVEVPADASPPGLEVRRDGDRIAEPAWGVAMPLDPGSHTITATAPGRVAWQSTLTVGTSGESLTLKLPALALAAPPARPPSAVEPPRSNDAPRSAPERPASANEPSRAPAYVVFALAAASLGTGAYAGMSAISKHRAFQDACPDPHACTAEGKQTFDEAKTAADVSTVTTAVGLGALAVGAWLYFRSPAAGSAATSGLAVSPALGPHDARVSLGGAW